MAIKGAVPEAIKDDMVRRYVDKAQSTSFIAFALDTSAARVTAVLKERKVQLRTGAAKVRKQLAAEYAVAMKRRTA